MTSIPQDMPGVQTQNPTPAQTERPTSNEVDAKTSWVAMGAIMASGVAAALVTGAIASQFIAWPPVVLLAVTGSALVTMGLFAWALSYSPSVEGKPANSEPAAPSAEAQPSSTEQAASQQWLVRQENRTSLAVDEPVLVEESPLELVVRKERQLDRQLVSVQSDIASIQAQHSRALAQIPRYEAELADTRTHEANVRQLTRDLGQANRQLEQAQVEVRQYSGRERVIRSELGELSPQLNTDLSGAWKWLTDSTVRSEWYALKGQVDGLQSELGRIYAPVNAARAEVNRVSRRLAAAQNRPAELRRLIASSQRTAHECQARLQYRQRQLLEYRSELESVQAERQLIPLSPQSGIQPAFANMV